MADMFAPLVAQLKANPKTIVFTEGNDPRILEAASKLLAEGVLKVVMVGNEAECKAAAAAGNFDISAAEIIDPENYAGFDEMVNTMVELRKGKQTAEECTALLKKSNYFGTMLGKQGKADCLLGGATYSTADTIRPALQLVKTKKGAHLVSSCFILDRDCGEEGLKRIAMGDCAVNIDYTDTVDKATGEVKIPAAAKLAEVAVETAKTAKLFGIDPKVAVLSFSTKGSGKGGTGKSTVSVLLGAQLGAWSRRVLLIELDSGLRSVDMIAGVYGKTVYDIEDVLCGRCDGSKAIVPSPLYPGLSVISAPYEGGEVRAAPLAGLILAMR